MHAYVVENWSHVPILISLDRVLEGKNSKNLIKIIMVVVCNGGGLGK
jgi:hypothetical protein